MFIGAVGLSLRAQGSTVIDVSVKVLSFEGQPLRGLSVRVSDTPQVPQTTDANGETKWKFATGSTYSFYVTVKAGDSWSSPTNELNVRIFVADSNSSQQTIKLPRLVKASLPLKDADGFGADLLPVSYGAVYNDVALEVNGKSVFSVSEFGAPWPTLLEVRETQSGKVADFVYFEPRKLIKPDKSDIDGDLIPDSTLRIPSPYGALEITLPSATLVSSPPSISVAQVTWIKATEDNEGVSLALMQGGSEVTGLFPSGQFSVHAPSPRITPGRYGGYVPGIAISGSRARYSLLEKSGPQRFVFGYSVNGVSLGLSSLKQIIVQRVACLDTVKGVARTWATLGDCPKGWASVSALKGLSEKRYSSCTALNKVLVGGVGRSNAVNFGKRAFKGWLTHNAGYLKNKHLDADKDGIACER